MAVSLLLLLLTFAAQAPQSAVHTAVVQDSVALEAATAAVASELRCPVCQGLSIEDSPSTLAQSMRAVIRDQLAEGKTPEEVKAYFVGRYGEWVLLRPEARGFNLTVYLLPAAAVLGGAIFLVFVIRRWARRSAGAESLEVVGDEEPDLVRWE